MSTLARLAHPTENASLGVSSTCEAAWTFRRAAIIGAGSMGTLLAAVLGTIMPVTLVCRNADRASSLFRNGARVGGLLRCSSRPIVVGSISDIACAGGASAVFVATKTSSTAEVAEELAPHLDEIRGGASNLFVVSFQNGIDSGRELMQRLGHPDVVRMVLTLGATLDEADGHVEVSLHQPPHGIGSVDSAHGPACAAMASALTRAGLETVHVGDIESLVWQKALINAAMNPVAALANCTVGEVLDGPSRIIFERLVEEGLEVAAASGIELPDDYVARAMCVTEHARSHVPSMVEDIRQGRESEVGQLNRQIIDRAHRLGVAVPTHEIIDALIETFDWKVYRRTKGGT